MKNRRELAKYFAKRGFKLGVEVGVHRGDYSQLLARTIPGLTLYSIDSWVFHERYKTPDNPNTKTNAHLRALNKLEPLGVNVVQGRSLDAVEGFSPASLDFVYIDADHSFDAVMQDIIRWGLRVRRGGILSGHDYTEGTGVKVAVDAYALTHKLRLGVTTELDDKARSWWMAQR